MTIVTIATPRGAHLGLREDDLRIASQEARHLFALEMPEDGQVALMPLALPGLFLQAENGGGGPVTASSGDIGPQARFVLDEGDEIATFQAPDGVHYLSETEDGDILFSATSVGPNERFVVTRHDPSVAAGGHCCGHRRAILSDEPEPAWEDQTHIGIVTKAHSLMNPHGNEFPEAAHAVGTLNNPHIWQPLLQGLHDADYEGRFTGIDYSPHFYDPDLRRNFRYPWPSANPNARSEGARFFHLSVAGLANILFKIDNGITVTQTDYNACGYLLGVACHFLTDLTQPMHAANFANYVGQGWPGPPIAADKRHTDFEKNAERQVKAGYLDDVPWLPRETFQIHPRTRPFDLLHETARHAKKMFDEHLAKVVPRKLRWVSAGRSGYWQMIPFTDGEVRTVLDHTLKGPSLQAAARFFTLWWRIADRQRKGAVAPGRWYRIKESTKKEYLRRSDKWIHRWKLEANNDDFLHGFRRNADGSYYVVCKSQQDRVWTSVDIWGRPDVNPTELKPLGGDAERQKFVPVADGEHTWLFTLYNHEPLRIREGADWDGHVIRWTPDITYPHLFQLEDAGPMSADDAAAIDALEER